jgi:hypothetical protein
MRRIATLESLPGHRETDTINPDCWVAEDDGWLDDITEAGAPVSAKGGATCQE